MMHEDQIRKKEEQWTHLDPLQLMLREDDVC